jgi:REP element-mobilizing transposase RayT
MQTVIPLKPGGFYHIFDRGVNRENIFLEERNYIHFLSLYATYIIPVAETYAYCLLRNHFHILVRIREPQTEAISKAASAHVSKAFNNFLTAYAKAFNKAYDRTGALFQHHFHRIPVPSYRYFSVLVLYIHHNPCKHGFVKDFQDWPFSSYHELASKAYTQLARPKVMEWFDGANGFRKSHTRPFQEMGFRNFFGNDMD